MKTFFKGTLLLVIAAFIGECVEFLINLVLAKELGGHGMGLYMTILPSIFLVVILASLELPVSISKFIAEKEDRYHRSMLKHATVLTTVFTAIIMSLAFIILPIIPLFNDYHPFVKWLVIIFIPIVSFLSIARGYFMGIQSMGHIAFANFLRKAVQLILLVFIYQLLEFEIQTSILIALCTIVASDLIVFGYLGLEYMVHYRRLGHGPTSALSGKVVRRNLLAVSLPTTGMRIFHAISHAVQPFLIKAALLKAGMSIDVATEHFGLMTGVALTIGFFPAFIAHSLLIVLIPTVSEAYAKRDMSMLQSLLQQVMRITFLYGIPACVIFYYFAEPLTHIFFESSSATVYLQMLWPYFLFHFFLIPMQAYLIGLGLVKDAFIHNVWSTVVSFGIMFALGSLQTLQMEGIIIGMNMGAVLLALMHYVTICRKIGVSVISTKFLGTPA
ncbi:polysaccharide biosynthesis protein [Fredinandcohnia sp. QZ13]|uniref:polysaccharide biosynthesis protein n=1 Tax=Fredinandcohnia sp. QZ13 TaxID=3073144 RepID=UPI002853205D|nr:polysaccharide biosynthesis protein [Fredinandcohnia sp. QZ13]MDR4887940.1 polysaccharide biosynthesis protein [Fredinandcohnia sp. QZ13]